MSGSSASNGMAVWRSIVRIAIECVLVGLILGGAIALAGWPWSALQAGVAVVGWGGLRWFLAWVPLWRGVSAAWRESVAGLVVLGGGDLAGSAVASLGQKAWVFGAALVLLAGWRWWCARSVAQRMEPVAEALRVLLVAVVAVGVMTPLFTANAVGGTDARWYAYMLQDFLTQWRTQGPPVFLGQGEFAWNGAVHPFRSAPVYLYLAGCWDWLTFGALPTLALRHLTAITAALAAGLGFYAAGNGLVSGRRNLVAALAMLYVLAPAPLMALYTADAYMTYLAAAVFVLVLYGNCRLLLGEAGAMALAAGLSLAWMTHPPTAMLVSLITVGLQAGGLALGQCSWADFKRLAAVAGWFAGCSLHYFAAMGELPSAPAGGMRTEVLQVLALLAGWFAGARVLVMRGSAAWALVLVPVIAGLWFTSRIWLGWLGVTLFLLGAVMILAKRFRSWDPADHGALVSLGAIVGGAAIMDGWLRHQGAAYPTEIVYWARAWGADFLRPLEAALDTTDHVQPGWGLVLAGAVGCGLALRRRAVALQLVVVSALLLSVCLVRWRWAGEFMVEFVPLHLRSVTGSTIPLRTMPVLAALLAFAGLLALRALPPGGSRLVRGLPAVLAGVALVWAASQARHLVARGFSVTASPERTATQWRSENVPMDRFVFDLLKLPRHFSHGKMDPYLEVRLRDGDGNVQYGPEEITAAMEATGSRTYTLVTEEVRNQPEWLQCEPRIVLQPGERRLLRFEFDPERTYKGYLFLFSAHGYREYRMPDSGLDLAFGAGPGHGRVLSLWNSGREAETYQVQFHVYPGCDLAPGMRLATVTSSEFVPSRADVHVESLNPWRARTRLAQGGWLDTPRAFVPGYEVRLNGLRVGPEHLKVTADHLLAVEVPPGEHRIEVRYVGTVRLWVTGAISLAVWLVLAGRALHRLRRRESAAAAA